MNKFNSVTPFKGLKCKNCSQPFNRNNDIYRSYTAQKDVVTVCEHCKRKNIIYNKTGELHLVKRKQEQGLKEYKFLDKDKPKKVYAYLVGLLIGLLVLAGGIGYGIYSLIN